LIFRFIDRSNIRIAALTMTMIWLFRASSLGCFAALFFFGYVALGNSDQSEYLAPFASRLWITVIYDFCGDTALMMGLVHRATIVCASVCAGFGGA